MNDNNRKQLTHNINKMRAIYINGTLKSYSFEELRVHMENSCTRLRQIDIFKNFYREEMNIL